MKTAKKKLFMSFIACFMACMMFAIPVMAASYTWSKTTIKLNAINGGSSATSTVTSGSIIGTNPQITKVEFYCNVASGTDPYTIYVQSPDGTIASFSGPTKSGSFTTDVFNGEKPGSTWKIWIVNNGVSYNGNIYPASTVTITITVTYSST